MTVTFTITINNNSDVNDRIYYLFQEKPVQDQQNDSDIFTNVYSSSPPLSSGDGSNVQWELKQEYFAICGVPHSALAKGVKVSSSSYLPVTISKGGPSPTPGSAVFLTTTDDSPHWQHDKTSTSSDAENGFTISTDDSFEYPNKRNLFVGLGARDPNRDNHIVPVATFTAQPAEEYMIYPKSIYYIATGTYSEGAIVDFKGMGKTLQIDFGKSNLHDVSFTQEPSGDYVPDDANSKKLGTMMTH